MQAGQNMRAASEDVPPQMDTIDEQDLALTASKDIRIRRLNTGHAVEDAAAGHDDDDARATGFAQETAFFGRQ